MKNGFSLPSGRKEVVLLNLKIYVDLFNTTHLFLTYINNKMLFLCICFIVPLFLAQIAEGCLIGVIHMLLFLFHLGHLYYFSFDNKKHMFLFSLIILKTFNNHPNAHAVWFFPIEAILVCLLCYFQYF